MSMILTKNGLGEIMINLETGRMFRRELTQEEIEGVQQSNRLMLFEKIQNSFVTAEEQLEGLTNAGFELDEIVEFALMMEA